MRNLLIEGIEKVNSDMWKNFISHTNEVEKKFWNLDYIVDKLTTEQRPLVLNVGNSDEDDDSDDDLATPL